MRTFARLVAGAVVLPGCTPDIPNGVLSCGDSSDCPSGFECRARDGASGPARCFDRSGTEQSNDPSTTGAEDAGPDATPGPASDGGTSDGEDAAVPDAGCAECDASTPEPKPDPTPGDNAYSCSCTCQDDARTFSVRPASSSDDAEQYLDDGTMIVQGRSLDMPAVPESDQIIGLRFADIPIPRGATIGGANLQFTSRETRDGTTLLTFEGEASDDARPYSATDRDLEERARGAARVMWDVPAWQVDESGPPERSPNLSAIIQEIVSRSGWQTGNALALLITGTGSGRAAASFDTLGVAASARPLLSIQYSLPPLARTVEACLPDALRGAPAPDEQALRMDCEGRVLDTFGGMAEACDLPARCSCALVPSSRTRVAACDECAEAALASDCANFPRQGAASSATNASGDVPVCGSWSEP